jgi:hypothetical protein
MLGPPDALFVCFKISGELLETFTYRLHHMSVVDAVENPVGFHSTASAVSFFFLLLSPLARREISFHEPFEAAGILLDEWGQQV